jgi:hypothetical protein
MRSAYFDLYYLQDFDRFPKVEFVANCVDDSDSRLMRRGCSAVTRNRSGYAVPHGSCNSTPLSMQPCGTLDPSVQSAFAVRQTFDFVTFHFCFPGLTPGLVHHSFLRTCFLFERIRNMQQPRTLMVVL